jgi:hypothetical protein
MSQFKITRLKNGAQVLALKEIGEGFSIVLAKPNKNEFVTWLINTNHEAIYQYAAVAGNYFTKLPDAIRNYNQRR